MFILIICKYPYTLIYKKVLRGEERNMIINVSKPQGKCMQDYSRYLKKNTYTAGECIKATTV